MAAFHFIISPPRKPEPRKVEKITEELPRLMLAPFNSTPEIKFGDVLVNSKATKKLIIYNPAKTGLFVGRFGNVDSDDRIFLNGCDIKSCELNLQSHEEVEVEVTWGPIHTGYLRKTIRIYDVSKKARSFEVILRGMAIQAKNVKNVDLKKLKENNSINRLPEKEGLNSTVTLTTNQKKIDGVNAVRRQTYTINGKENFAPDALQITKSIFKSSSPIFPKELSNLNVLHENFASIHFSIQSFSPDDCVDAPMKYSNFKSNLDLSTSISNEFSHEDPRRSTAMNFSSKENEISSSTPDKNYLTDFDKISSLNSNVKDETNFSTPVWNNFTSDSLNAEISIEHKLGNLTFDFKNLDNADVFLTPQKNFNLDTLILSPPSKLKDSLSFISKSSDCLNSIERSFKSYKRNDLFFVSPPQKFQNRRSKKSPEDLFPHRSGSSVISDRKKLLKTSFLSRKKISPNSVTKNRGPRRISAFGCDNISTVEKVRTRNPQTLKQAVSSHCQINDPFLKQVLYNEDKWAESQEKGIIKWINSVLAPPFELSEETNEWTVNVAETWLKSSRVDESSTISGTNKVPPLYSGPQKLNILRKRKNSILESEPVKTVFQNLTQIVNRKTIFVRDDRDLHADEGLKKKLLRLLSCYNPVWLRMGLEAVYDQEIALQPKADVGGLGLFIRKKLLSNAAVNRRKINSTSENIKKAMLLTFLKLVYFMDQARVQKLIRYDRCLFTLSSNYKSSQDLLSAFCADLIVGRGYVMKHLKSIDYNLKFKQTCVDEYNYSIKSLDDLRDGVRLVRLFEILFMERDLCSKLRVPAIDIENKKHNVEVAMKVARSRCTIEGNITAEDIVLGNRAGSRMKTLSFLWQIINSYLTPLYERAATRIQKWWRVRRMHHLLKNFVLRAKERSALVIQSAWRGYIVRKRFRNAILERKRLNMAALIVQRRFRAFLLAKRERTALKMTVNATLTLQRWWRRVYACRRFIELRTAAVCIQRRYRALKLMAVDRRRFLHLKRSAILLQQLRRANIATRENRNRYLQMRLAAIEIQRRFRATRIMRMTRTHFATLKRCTIFLQRKFRATLAMKTDRRRYAQLKRHVINMQRLRRNKVIAKIQQNQFLQLKRAAVVIQQKFRAIRAVNYQRRQYVLLKTNVIVIQRRYRAYKAMKIERTRYLRLLRAVIFVQRLFKGKIARTNYLRVKNTAIFIQRKFRARRAVKSQRLLYVQLKRSAVFVQRTFRANQLAKLERHRFVDLTKSVVFVQRKFRANRLCQLDRRRFATLRSATIFCQRKFRAKRAMQTQRNRFLAVKKNVIFLQRKFKANLAAKEPRYHFARLKMAVLLVQRKFRANRIAKTIRREYLMTKSSATIIQRWYRSVCLMRKTRDDYTKLKSLTIAIQKRFVALRTIKATCGANGKSLMNSQVTNVGVLELCKFNEVRRRAFDEMLVLRAEFLRLKMVVIFVQSQFRMKKQRDQFTRYRNAAVCIQRWWRSIVRHVLAGREFEANTRRVQRNAAIKIQALWRGYRLRKKIVLPVRSSVAAKKDKENPDSQGTLGERYRRAIDQLKTSNMYNVITMALWNLETVTTFSPKLCQGVALEGIVPIIFDLIPRGNRSEPSLELYRASFSILINLARYAPTKIILWNSMHKDRDVIQIVNIIKMTHDKFLRKNDVDVFRNSATLLWLLCQDAPMARYIASVSTLQIQIQKMMETLNKRCPCKKNSKTKRCRTLPKTESNWYADPQTRTFSDNCFAISCIYRSLFFQ